MVTISFTFLFVCRLQINLYSLHPVGMCVCVCVGEGKGANSEEGVGGGLPLQEDAAVHPEVLPHSGSRTGRL